MTIPGRTERLVLPGVLTAEQAAETVRGIAAVQRPDGSIPWFTGGHLDPWDHVEAAMALDAAGEHRRAAAAYRWLAASQNEDGSWYAAYVDGRPTERRRETNFCAYIPVGVWHHYLSTGDDSNPFDSSGYTPIDERTNRNPVYDAQRTAGNTNDLRGKVLRIKVNADGSYSIPSGNLFPPGTARTRPEIYAMGLRNPFRIGVDKATGVLYVRSSRMGELDVLLVPFTALAVAAIAAAWRTAREQGRANWGAVALAAAVASIAAMTALRPPPRAEGFPLTGAAAVALAASCVGSMRLVCRDSCSRLRCCRSPRLGS